MFARGHAEARPENAPYNLCVQVLRLHDPGRRPASWTEIIQPGQFAAFAKNLDSGAPCDAKGRSYLDPSQVACLVFDSLDESQAYCESAANRTPAVQFEIFDAAGRANPPLITVVHPSRAGAVEADPAVLRRRRVIAWTLIAAAIPTLVVGYYLRDGGHQIFAGFVGLNMLVAAGRLLWFNMAVRETEELRRRRLAKATGRVRSNR
jgi:hypothetical protein